MLKKIFIIILHAGAVACALAGLVVIYTLFVGLRFSDSDSPYELLVLLIYACLAFTPAFMHLKGLKTKTWHWVLIASVEVIVLALALWALFALIALAKEGFGE